MRLVGTALALASALMFLGPLSTASADATSPFDVSNPTVGRLDPALLAAVQQAATAAAAEGIPMTITSGWRTPEFQQ